MMMMVFVLSEFEHFGSFRNRMSSLSNADCHDRPYSTTLLYCSRNVIFITVLLAKSVRLPYCITIAIFSSQKVYETTVGSRNHAFLVSSDKYINHECYVLRHCWSVSVSFQSVRCAVLWPYLIFIIVLLARPIWHPSLSVVSSIYYRLV